MISKKLKKQKVNRNDLSMINDVDHQSTVTHVDNSARVQSVFKHTNPLFYNLINEFKKLTGVPILVNTSFNIRGEPVICST